MLFMCVHIFNVLTITSLHCEYTLSPFVTKKWVGSVFEEVAERMWPLFDLQTGPIQLEASYSLPCPRNLHSTYYSYINRWFKDAVLRAICCWDYLDDKHAWALLRPLNKCLRFWYIDPEVYSSRGHPSPEFMSCCSLKLPPTHLEGSPCFFSLSLPSTFGAQFWISPEKLWGCKPTVMLWNHIPQWC